MNVSVLRLGHRFARDKRISTHLGLTARALGAREIIYDAADPDIAESVGDVVSAWGGEFKVSFTKDYRRTIKNFKGVVVHLTMYGLPLTDKIGEIRKRKKDVLVIVGGAKVPAGVYKLADYNVSVGNQPHSEVAALAVFLDKFFGGKELRAEFSGGKKIIPQERGKKVVD
jgi:tRNA (cytidine56-2'-O)-methyltransferase